MTTQNITYALRHADGTPWADAELTWKLLTTFADSSSTYPIDDIVSTTGEDGTGSQALAVPDDPEAAARYRVDFPNGAAVAFNLSASVGDVALEDLVILALTTADPNSVLTLIEAHTNLVAAEDVLGHIMAHADQIDGDGYLVIGGAVESVNTQTGAVVLSAASVDADATGTAAGLVATEATARANADSTHAAAADPHPGYLTPAEGNAAYQPLDADLTAIAALTTTSYGRALLALADAAAGRTALGAAPATPLTQALTDQASIAWNTALGAFATLTIGGNRTLANPTNLTAGASYALKITQDGTGSRTLAYGSAFKWVSGAAPVLSTAIGAVDVLTCISDGTNIYGVLQKAWA